MKKSVRGFPRSGLRIVAGSLRGSRLDVPDLPGLRPTPDRIRETLFNWLQPVIDGARCLDLFAGSGALGIEALSRGAAACVFVERERRLAALIANNLARLHVDRGRVVSADAEGFLAAPDSADTFDVVFLDPPFEADLWSGAAQALEGRGWLADNALVYVESPREIAPAVPANWLVHREAHAGAVRFALYRRLALDPLS
jgi:16S rRNA (guanine966-N2)-methyltransferase